MSAPYRVKLIVTETGERLPLLLNADGAPVFEPTVFVLTRLRSRGQATATLDAALRSIMLLSAHCERARIDLDERIRTCKFLDSGELLGIADAARRYTSELSATPKPPTNSKIIGFVSMEKYRRHNHAKAHEERSVSREYAAARLYYIRAYLRWRIDAAIARLPYPSAEHAEAMIRRDRVFGDLDALIPMSRRSTVHRRKGPTEGALDLLLEIIRPESPNNPWRGEHVRRRNQLLVLLALQLGLRRGEIQPG